MPRWFYVALLIALVLGTVIVYREILAPPVLKVDVLATGENSAVLVRGPSGKTILINAGRDASILRALGGALPMWQRRLDAVIVTREAAGSKGGLPSVIERYRIGTLIRSATRGDRFALGGGAYLDVLWPPETPTPMNADNNQLVLRLSYGTTSVLIQNDLPPRISRYLSTLDTNLPAPDLIISSSTPAGAYISNGQTVARTK